MVFYGSIVHWNVGGMYPQYMYILLIVKVIWCNIFHRCIVNWSGGIYVFSVYVHSAICDTYLV